MYFKVWNDVMAHFMDSLYFYKKKKNTALLFILTIIYFMDGAWTDVPNLPHNKPWMASNDLMLGYAK